MTPASWIPEVADTAGARVSWAYGWGNRCWSVRVKTVTGVILTPYGVVRSFSVRIRVRHPDPPPGSQPSGQTGRIRGQGAVPLWPVRGGGRQVEQLTQHDPRRIGPFEVLGRLGAGGMGLVYLARSASSTARGDQDGADRARRGPAVPRPFHARGGGRPRGQRLLHGRRRGRRPPGRRALAGHRLRARALPGGDGQPVRPAARAGRALAGRRYRRGARIHPRRGPGPP